MKKKENNYRCQKCLSRTIIKKKEKWKKEKKGKEEVIKLVGNKNTNDNKNEDVLIII